ncbi:MAG: hypothetical protein KAS30_03580, partial [Candidatus Diapherotrites archaeon]|nr:hypothetical protein [Candidatus Diapherotrites archaeon]
NFNACDKSNKVEMFSELLAEPNQKQFLDQELGKKIETQTIFVKINPKGLPLKLCKFEIHWVKMNFLSVFGNFLVDTEIRKSVHKEILRKPVEHKLFEFVINNLTKVLKINQEIGLIEQTFANNKDPNHSEWFKNQLNERMKKKPFYIKKATFETKVIKQIHEEKYDKLNKITDMKRDIINTLEKIFDKVDLISNDANSLDVISNDILTNLINENVLQMLIKINRKLLLIIDVFVYDGLFEPTPHINKKTIIELMAKSTSQLEDQ